MSDSGHDEGHYRYHVVVLRGFQMYAALLHPFMELMQTASSAVVDFVPPTSLLSPATLSASDVGFASTFPLYMGY